MNSLKLYPVALLAVLAILSVESCSNVPSSPPSSKDESPATATSPSSDAKPSVKLSPSPAVVATPPQKTVSINFYRADSQCQTLVAEKVAVSANQPMEAAIAKVLEEQDSADFSVAGYRLSVQNAVAIVDLRVAPGSKRSFQSLSSCEQLALFGSLRRTLTGNPEWNVESVQFTDQGKEIVL